MRRLIAILLLTLLSLQSTWAVAAVYCEHETSRDAAHFGHHVDGHTAAAAFDDVDGGDASAPADGHCHDCHASPIGVILPLVQATLALTSNAIGAAPAPRLPAPPPEPLERPDWRHLA